MSIEKIQNMYFILLKNQKIQKNHEKSSLSMLFLH